jgi:hypothetical protein
VLKCWRHLCNCFKGGKYSPLLKRPDYFDSTVVDIDTSLGLNLGLWPELFALNAAAENLAKEFKSRKITNST